MAEVIELEYDAFGRANYYYCNKIVPAGRYVRESDYLALMHDKLAIEGRVNQLVDNYNTLLERHRRLVKLLKTTYSKFPKVDSDYSGCGRCYGCGAVQYCGDGKGKDPCKPGCLFIKIEAALAEEVE